MLRQSLFLALEPEESLVDEEELAARWDEEELELLAGPEWDDWLLLE
jgi:hypothetical protein